MSESEHKGLDGASNRTTRLSLPISKMQAYVAEVRAALETQWPGKATLTVFGHLGDGNLHLVSGVGLRHKRTKQAVEAIVYGGLRERAGSVSAEHGIGLEKRDYLGWSRTPEGLLQWWECGSASK